MDFSRTEVAKDHQIFLSGYRSSISLIQIAGSCEVCSSGSPQGTLEWWVSVSFFSPSGEYCHWFLSAYTLLSSKFPKALKNIWLKEITFLGFVINFPSPVNYIVTLFFIVAITNAINLIDGLDGLAGGISSIYFATIAIIAFILNKLGGLDVTLALIMLGATLGFLVYNFP